VGLQDIVEANVKSRASFRGHPIHPALIPFPFAFLYGAFFFDIAGVLLDRAGLWTTGGYLALAGVLLGLAAAVPGVIDYFFTVPPNSTGQTRARKHALANVTALALFATAWWLRSGADAAPGPISLTLEAVGLVALTVGGWMGGTLVARNQISVDHRYAGAGRWREQRVEVRAGQPLVLRRPDALENDHLMLLHAGGRRLVLGRTEEGFVAFDDHCTHRGAALADGVMICGTVQCPWHGSQFDVRTGAVRAGPAQAPIAAYRVEEDGDELRIHLT
jgi:nitrite reductase/ring-hydroxylating ferredoxin subunit/uncharacterized membrane protein